MAVDTPQTGQVDEYLNEYGDAQGDKVVVSVLWIGLKVKEPDVEEGHVSRDEGCHVAVQNEWLWVVALDAFHQLVTAVPDRSEVHGAHNCGRCQECLTTCSLQLRKLLSPGRFVVVVFGD